MQIVHAENISHTAEIVDGYFKLFHYCEEKYDVVLDNQYIFADAKLPNDFVVIARIINECYGYEYEADDIKEWIQYPVFDNDLWVFIKDKNSGQPVALGIADFDKEIGEGSLEWIQVLPSYQSRGFGSKIVFELLRRFSIKGAKFITVSGQIDNKTNPERLYRKCGFVGDDVWLVVKSNL